jgi:hypothetical protein
MENEDNELFERLILMGAVEPAGMDMDSGEMLFSFSPELSKVSPELANAVTEHFTSVVMTLWSKGFLNIETSEESEDLTISLTEQSIDPIALSLLSNIEKNVMANVVAYFIQDQV